MGKTLHELATHLQESIIKQQEDAHNSTNLNVSKYNNLKLKMDSTIRFAHVIITIGISQATFNLEDGTKTEGGLGPDERYVKKWMGNSSIIYDLKEIYKALGDLVKAEEVGDDDDDIAQKRVENEGEAGEVKIDAPRVGRLKKHVGLVTVEEDIENQQMLENQDIDVELEASALDGEDKDHMRLTKGYALESLDSVKQDLKAFLNSSSRKKFRRL